VSAKVQRYEELLSLFKSHFTGFEDKGHTDYTPVIGSYTVQPTVLEELSFSRVSGNGNQ